jgi:hypothetical protein
MDRTKTEKLENSRIQLHYKKTLEMSAPKNAEIVKIRISEQRNCQSPELLLHCLMKENRINPTGSTVELFQEAIKLENEIDAGLDPLLEVDVILRAKSLIKKCSTSPIETHNGKKCPNLRLYLSYGANPEKWSLGAVTKFTNSKGKIQPITALARAPIKIDSLPPLTEITQPIRSALMAEEIVDALDALEDPNAFSDDDVFITAVSQSNTFLPETDLSDSSPISPIIKPLLIRARKRKARTLSVPKKRTKK